MTNQKHKHLHNISIDNGSISTKLAYTINTNEIWIGNTFSIHKKSNFKRSEMKCSICGNKLSGNQRKYCCDECRKLAHIKQMNNYYKNNKNKWGNQYDTHKWNYKNSYCEKFDNDCRESNRSKYNNECFICGKPESENLTKSGKIRKLSVHHVDMNKQQGCNDTAWQLVPLCLEHHATAHTPVWESRIQYLLSDLKDQMDII